MATREIKHRFYGQEKIVQWLITKLGTVKKQLQRKISEYLK